MFNNLYALLQFLLLYGDDKEYIYITRDNINPKILEGLKGEKIIYPFKKDSIVKVRGNFFKKALLKYKLKKEVLKKVKKIKFLKYEIFSQDNAYFTRYILNRKKYTLLEDGLATYTVGSKRVKKKEYLKSLVTGKPICFGRSYWCSKAMLTGLKEIPNDLLNKSKVIDIDKIWKDLSEKRKREIFKIFNLNLEEIEILVKFDAILFTQPISEDGNCSEEEKKKIYRDITKDIDERKLVVKPHPRENTNYHEVFPKSYILKKDFPAELISFIGVDFHEVITLYSTIALNIRGKHKLRWYGEDLSKLL